MNDPNHGSNQDTDQGNVEEISDQVEESSTIKEKFPIRRHQDAHRFEEDDGHGIIDQAFTKKDAVDFSVFIFVNHCLFSLILVFYS